MEEIWKKLPDLSQYEISNRGNIRSLRRPDGMVIAIDRYGYAKIHLKKDDGSNLYTTIHRLVARAFLERPGDEYQVNHINGDKLDNRVENLEWVTVKENIEHSFDMLLNDNTNPIVVYDKDLDVYIRYRSVKHFAKDIKTWSNVVVPFIKHSDKYPFMGRYVIRLEDERKMLEPIMANAVNCGLGVWVYDHVEGSVTHYQTANQAAYVTGVRSLSGSIVRKVFFKLGYSFARDKKDLVKRFDLSIEQLKINREAYLSAPYRKQNGYYIVYDYEKDKEYVFNGIKDLVTFINLHDVKPVTVGSIGSLIGNEIVVDKAKNTKAGHSLIRGFGVMTENRRSPKWYAFNEETILASRRGLTCVGAGYMVHKDNHVFYVHGTYNLHRHYGFTQIQAKKAAKEGELILGPNFKIVRLNKPMRNKKCYNVKSLI